MAIAVRETVLPKSRVTPEGQVIARALRTLRQSVGLTQRQVAEHWGISLDGYRPWEAGKRQLRVSQIPGLAKALTVSESDLRQALGMDDAPPLDVRDMLRRDLSALFPPNYSKALADAVERISQQSEQEQADTIRILRRLVRDD